MVPLVHSQPSAPAPAPVPAPAPAPALAPAPAPQLATVFGIPHDTAKAIINVLRVTRDLPGPGVPFPVPVDLAPLNKIASGTVEQENAMLRRAQVLDTDTEAQAVAKVVAFLEQVRPTVKTSTLGTYAEASANALYNRGKAGPWAQANGTLQLRALAMGVQRHVPTPMPVQVPRLSISWDDLTLQAKLALTVMRHAPVALRWGDLEKVRSRHIFQAEPPLPPGIGVRLARQKAKDRCTDVLIPEADPMASVLWARRTDNNDFPLKVPDRQKVHGHQLKHYSVVWGQSGNHAPGSTAWMHYRFDLVLDPELSLGSRPIEAALHPGQLAPVQEQAPVQDLFPVQAHETPSASPQPHLGQLGTTRSPSPLSSEDSVLTPSPSPDRQQ